MKIDLESTMLKAAQDGEYQPVFRGEALDVEASMPEVSLRNLRKLLEAGLKPVSMIAVEHGHILVVFQSGETYLATGFALANVQGSRAGDPTRMFAQFASEAFPGNQRDWENYFGWFFPADYEGVIKPTAPVSGKPKVFNGE